jgi:hypothetical protein
VTWHPEEGQPGPGRGLAILAAVFALALALVGAGMLYLELVARSGSSLPTWLPGELPASLKANGPPIVAAGALLVGLLGLLAANSARRPIVTAPPAVFADDGAVERLRRQVEPLATGDLAVWLPDAEGALGEIHRTLNLLIGGVGDLVAAADDASVRLLGSAQDGRGGIAALAVEVERCRGLADDLVERARRALSAARGLRPRKPSSEPVAVVAAAEAGRGDGQDPDAPGVLVERLEGIAEVIRDLAEQARVLAVGISVQAAAADAPAVLHTVGEDVALLAEQAARAVGRIGPLANAALEAVRAVGPERRTPATCDRGAGGSAASHRLADEIAALAEVATSLRASADRVALAQADAAASLGALTDLAQRLRRATGRFRLPG